MDTPKVFIVHLRRPNRQDPHETRGDPFFEFGSFGCTSCHSDNLMGLDHADDLEGARIGFAQGGNGGFRLVLLTPPVTVRKWAYHLELKWTPALMPFKYLAGAVLVSNERSGDFPRLEEFLRDVDRDTPEGQFSSRFRTRSKPLDSDLAQEVIEVYERLRAAAAPKDFADTYDQALPYPPTITDRNRQHTYRKTVQRLELELNGGGSPEESDGKSGCGPRTPRDQPSPPNERRVCR